MQKRRYPGVSPFTSEQKDIFFGRENDIKRLYKLISMRKQVLLYAKSGIGKTSLLNAGVLPQLEKKYTLIKIRFFAYDNKNSISPVEKMLNSLKNAVGQEKSRFLDNLIRQTDYKKTLWYYFKKLQFSGKQKFILVFDQFEELFSYPEELVNQFKNELHELTNIDIPNEIKQKIAESEESESQEIDVLYEDLDIKTVFAIRSDRLSLLNQLTDKIPDIQEIFYELKALDIEQTKLALVQPAQSSALFETKAFNFSAQAINKIISALSEKGKQNIEATQLQIVCQRIEDIAQEKYESSLKKETISISNNDLPEFKDIFLNFYENVVKNAVSAQSEKAISEIRKFIEDQLIRNKQRISLDAIICRDYVEKSILQKLVNTHLLRAERNSTGGFSYELSHDTLVAPILESRKKRVEKEEEEEKLRTKDEEIQRAKKKAEKERIESEKEHKRQEDVLRLEKEKTFEVIKVARLAQENVDNQKKSIASQARLIYIIMFIALISVSIAIFAYTQMKVAERASWVMKEMLKENELDMLNRAIRVEIEEWSNFRFYNNDDTIRKNLKSVQKLNLSRNRLTHLPNEIGFLVNLKQLDLSDNSKLNILPNEINYLKGITLLNLKGNDFSNSLDNIFNFTSLKDLNLTRNRITDLPPTIKRLKKLEILDLRKNRLSKIPVEIGSLVNLKYLNFNKNRLEYLPQEIGNLKNLKYLNLGMNKLTDLPIEIKNLEKLEMLNLLENPNLDLKTFYAIFSNYPREIILSTNKHSSNTNAEILLIKIPKESVLSVEITKIKTLKRLDLIDQKAFDLKFICTIFTEYSNKLKISSREFEKESSTNNLTIKIPKQSQIPSEIKNLTNLEILDLYQSKLSKLPLEIGSLTNLKTLNLEGNNLISLPEELSNLANLEELFLRYNELTNLPEEIGKLLQLKKLDLRDNNLLQTEKERIKEMLPNCQIWF